MAIRSLDTYRHYMDSFYSDSPSPEKKLCIIVPNPPTPRPIPVPGFDLARYGCKMEGDVLVLKEKLTQAIITKAMIHSRPRRFEL